MKVEAIKKVFPISLHERQAESLIRKHHGSLHREKVSKFRLNGSAWRDSCSYDASIKESAGKIFRFCIAQEEAETHGQRFSRLKNWFEQFETAQAAAASI